MGDDLGRAQTAELAAAGQGFAASEAEEEAGRVEIAGAGRVHDLADGRGGHIVGLVSGDDDRAVLAPRHGGDRAYVTHLLDGGVEVAAGEQGEELGLVGEQDVDLAGPEQPQELISEVLDTYDV